MTKDEKFTNYYRMFSDTVYRYTYAKIKQIETAQDITQQVFYLFFINMEQVPDFMVKPWLFLCSKNKVIDEVRRTESRRKALYKGYLSEILTVSEDNTERLVERIVQEQLSFRILCDLRRKNESWYQIVEAVCVMEFSQEEAAKRLGISRQVLTAKLYRARHYLWEKYGAEYKAL